MNSDWMTRIGLQHPVVQAGMGGGVANSALATAVSRAGGLGTLGISSAATFRSDLQQTQQRCGKRPVAVNLLMPFLRSAHVDVCIAEKPAVAVLFLGSDAGLVRRLREAGIVVWQQIGDVAQAERALADGVDGLIAQGVEAGGHLAGNIPLADLLRELRSRVGQRPPVLAAGGIYDAATAQRARDLGADGVVAGTRFLLSPESGAHLEYKHRLLDAHNTLRTKLFGMAWPAYHRVALNAATERWARGDANGPRWTQIINAACVPLRRVLPLESGSLMVGLQRLSLPLFSPFPVVEGMDSNNIDTTPLYAGECVSAIDSLRSAAEVVTELARGFDA